MGPRVMAGAAVLALLAAAAFGAGALEQGDEAAPPALDFQPGRVIEVGLVIFLAVGLAVATVIIWQQRRLLVLPARERRPLARVIAGLAALVVLLVLALPRLLDDQDPAPARADAPAVTEEAESDRTAAWLLLAGAVAAAVAVVGTVMLRRRPAAPLAQGAVAVEPLPSPAAARPSYPPEAPGGPTRAAVLRSYAGMEDDLAGAGLGPQPPETARELLARAHDRLGRAASSAAELTEWYERARFSRHLIPPEAADAAEQSRRDVARRLEQAE